MAEKETEKELSAEQLDAALAAEGTDLSAEARHDAMMSGFNGEERQEEPELKEEAKEEEPEGKVDEKLEEKPEEAKEEPKEEPKDDTTLQIRRLTGKIGEINGKFKQMSSNHDTAQATIKKQADQLAAFKSKAKEEDPLTKDFPELSKNVDDRTAELKKEIADKGYMSKDDVRALLDEDRREQQFNVLRKKHPDHETVTVKGGKFDKWLDTQDEGVQALANSEYGDDASALIDLFYEAQKPTQVTEQQKKKESNITRLKGAVPPTKSGETRNQPTRTEMDYIKEGFKRNG